MAEENYYDSSYSQIAGGLLSRGKDKDKIGKAILAQIIESSITRGARDVKQSVVDGSKDVATKWAGIMESLGSDYDNASEDRKNVQDYKRNPDKYLTKKAIENIDLVTPGKNFTYATRFAKNVTNQQRKDLALSLDEEKLEIKELMDLMIKDPKLTINNRVDFLNPALKAGLAADKAVINDPTKRNLVAALYNRVFKTERNEDGELVTTNGKLLKLKNNADVAENVFLEQQKTLDKAELNLESYYKELLGQPVDKVNFDKVAPPIITVTAKEKREQVKLNNDVLYITKNNKKVPNPEYWSVAKNVTLTSSNGTTGTKTVDIKKEKFKNILIIDDDGEINNYSEQEFLQDVSTRQVIMRKAIEAQEGSTSPEIGVISFEGALDAFAKEGRFVEVSALNNQGFWRKALDNKNFNLDNSNSIIFIKPNTNVVNNQKVNTSDLIQASEDNSSIDEGVNLDGDKGDSSVYSHLALEAMMGNENFIQASVEMQNREVAELIKVHPEKEEEITALYDTFKSKEYGTSEIQISKTKETNTPVKSLLSSDNIYRTPSEIRADNSLSDIQKEDELSQKIRDDFNKSITSVPGKLKERGKNIERERAADFLSGEKSIFFSTSYSKWKRENDIVDKYNTPRKEKEKNVENYLEFLNQ